MILVAEILLLLIAIFWMRHLIQRQLIKVVLLMGGNQSQAIMIYSLIFLPGVILHELTHFVTAAVLGVKTGEINIFPQLKPDGNHRVTLGFVKIAKTDFIRESLIGMAPLISGLTVLGVLVRLITQQTEINWQLIGLLYGILTVTNTMYVSREDTRSFLPLFLFFGILLFLLWWLGYLGRIIWEASRLIESIGSTTLSVFILVLVVDIGWWLMLGLWQKILEVITHKRVI